MICTYFCCLLLPCCFWIVSKWTYCCRVFWWASAIVSTVNFVRDRCNKSKSLASSILTSNDKLRAGKNIPNQQSLVVCLKPKKTEIYISLALFFKFFFFKRYPFSGCIFKCWIYLSRCDYFLQIWSDWLSNARTKEQISPSVFIHYHMYFHRVCPQSRLILHLKMIRMSQFFTNKNIHRILSGTGGELTLWMNGKLKSAKRDLRMCFQKRPPGAVLAPDVGNRLQWRRPWRQVGLGGTWLDLAAPGLPALEKVDCWWIERERSRALKAPRPPAPF